MGFGMKRGGRNHGGSRRIANVVFAGLAALWLAGCSVPDAVNPVSWYRDAMGTADDDPPADTRNTANLEAGGTRDYPNLATVPPPPTRALSTAEREALTQRLVSDRANAKYIDDQLRGGLGVPAPRPVPPSATASAAPAVVARAAPAASPPQSNNTASSNAPPSSNAPSNDAPSNDTAATNPAPAASPDPAAKPAPAASAPVAAAAPAAPPAPPAAAPAATPAPAQAPARSESPSWVSLTAPPPVAEAPPAPAAAAPPPPAVAANGQPQESPLTSPAVRSLPEPEASRPPPPPPPASLAKGGAAATQTAARPPAAAPPPAPAAPTPTAGTPVAQVTFAANSARLSPSDRRIVGEVIPLQRQSGAAFRIVGYAAARGDSASQQLVNFRMALDRANAVASVLAQAGVAPDQILVETAPPTGESGGAANRAEIFLEN
jgi:outer membrane protein OmpA-like peptidoglycan-associated protein